MVEMFFRLSLTVLLVGLRSGFVGDFSFLGGVVCDGLVDPLCIFTLITSLGFSLFWTCWVGTWQNLAKCRFFRCSWNFGQSFVPTGPISLPHLYICAFGPARWGYKIYRLCLFWRVRLPQHVSWCNTKQSDGEAPVKLDLWRMQSTLSLTSLSVHLWPGVVEPNMVLSMGQM